MEENALKTKKRLVHRTSRGTLRRPRIPKHGFQIDFSWFRVLQGTPGNDLGSIFVAMFKAKSNGFRIDFDDAFLSIVGPLEQRRTDGDRQRQTETPRRLQDASETRIWR